MIVHTSSRTADNAVRVARVAAAGRVEADRRIREAREAREHAAALASATEWIEDLRALGANRVGFKHCGDHGKARFVLPVGEAAGTLARLAGEDVEAWGLTAQGEFVGEVW